MNAQALSLAAGGRNRPVSTARRRTTFVAVLVEQPDRLVAEPALPNDSDVLAGLIVAAAGGGRLAFQSLYMATSGKLLGTLVRLLNDRSEAEDVLQDVFVKIWRSAASFDPARGRPMTWMITIARYRAIDRLRSRRSTVDIDQVPETADPSPSAEIALAASDEARQLHGALARLAPRHAAAIRSAYFEGLTYEQLAEREGVPVGTLKSWVRRGLMQMRAELTRQSL